MNGISALIRVTTTCSTTTDSKELDLREAVYLAHVHVEGVTQTLSGAVTNISCIQKCHSKKQ